MKIEPSTRDSISTWLDVLTAMLVMPDTQRLQVRDELEDHLRSRVDDLLIMGKSESEAIRIAVAELGETAQLAKLITHAHTKSNPRRNIMNAALITVALAGMSFGGFTFINGTGAPSATPSNGGAVPVVVPEETKKTDEATHTFAINQASMMAILTEIAEAFDRNLEFSAESRKPQLDSFLGNHYGILEGEYTFDQVINHFKNGFSQGFYGYQLVCDDQTIQFMSENEYQRSLVVTRVYSYPKWLSTNDRKVYPDSLTRLIEVKHDLQFASIQGVGASIVVAASPAIHQEIMAYQTQLEVVLEEQQVISMERELEREKANDKNDIARRQQFAIHRQQQDAERKQAIKRIQAEFDRIRGLLVEKKGMINELNSKRHSLTTTAVSDVSTRRRDREISEIQTALVDTQLLYEEYQSRYNYLRDTLIESEYTELFKGLE